MQRIATFAAVVALCAVAVAVPIAGIADEELPTNPVAKSALIKLDQARARARQAYEKALKDAADQAVAELEKAKADVMKSGTPKALDEANKIAAAVETVREAAEPAMGRRPEGDWRFTMGTASREYRFLPSGAVVRLDDGKTVDVGRLKRDGDWWTFTDPALNRQRRIVQLDERVLVFANAEGNGNTIGYSMATRLK